MELNHICQLIDIRDQQVKAYIDMCLEKRENDESISIELIQTLATSYAQNLVGSFVAKHHKFLSEEQNKRGIYKYLSQIGADRPYSGNRFSEELYKALPRVEYGNENIEKE